MADKFWITDDQIRCMMRDARDRNYQITVLSQLCSTTEQYMLRYLKSIGADYGAEGKGGRRRGGQKRYFDPAAKRCMIALYNEGVSMVKIGERFDASDRVIHRILAEEGVVAI